MTQITEIVDKYGKTRFYRVDLRKIYNTLEDALADRNGELYELGRQG
jgi:hypothetical protein